MKKLLILPLLLCAFCLMGQKLGTKTGEATFFSEAILENIEAHNHKVKCVIDFESGEVSVSMLMSGFKFEKALMEQHFNENYVESSKYPKATFNGNIINLPELNMKQAGDYTLVIEGTLALHGVSKKIREECKMIVGKEQTKLNCEFILKPSDFNIGIPALLKENISENIKVKLVFEDLKRI